MCFQDWAQLCSYEPSLISRRQTRHFPMNHEHWVLHQISRLQFCFPLCKSDLEFLIIIRSDQIRSVAQSCPTLCDPMNRSTPGLPVHHQLLEFTQTHVHRVSDVIQPSHPLSSPSPLAPNPSQH